VIKPAETGSGKQAVRVIAYTRKSTSDHDSEFSTLHAQRQAIAGYVASQRALRWSLAPQLYDDNGFTGANTDRPAFRQLMADVEAGLVDVVATYKIDRLSRSLADFLTIMRKFEAHGVRFVSVTQSFDTTTNMGKFVLHLLASFSEFERGMISERTRDKMSAARRRGLWTGGVPILGLDARDGRLAVNEVEALRVRSAFDIYLHTRSLIRTAAELNKRGWTTKAHTSKKGHARPGRPFDKSRLHRLLSNVLYLGKVKYEGTIYEGAHQAIVEESVFRKVQDLLRANGERSGSAVRNRHQVLLKGLLRCATCDSAMSFSYAVRRNKRYGYYVCTRAQKRGWSTCPSPSVPMAEIEAFVAERSSTNSGRV